MTAALVMLLLHAAPERERLVVVDISTADKTAQRVAAQVSEQLITEAARVERFRVIGQSDISVLLGVERQKQLLGCADDASSCTAELAGALDARWILSGTLGRVGKKYRLDLKVIDSKSSLVEQRAGATMNAPEAVLELIPDMVKQLLNALPERKEEVVTVAPPPQEVVHPVPRATLPVPPLVLGGAGVLAAGVGGLLVGLAKSDEGRWLAVLATLSYDEATRFASGARVKADLGAGLLVGGGVALASAVVWFLVTRQTPAAVALSAGPGGVLVGGSW